MKITNDITVSWIPYIANTKVNAQYRSHESIYNYPTFKKAIAAYTIITQAHQLVTMALNISYELIQKAFATENDRYDAISKIAAINDYISQLSPHYTNAVIFPEVLQESSSTIINLQEAIKNNDTELVKSLHKKLVQNEQKLNRYANDLLETIPHAAITPDIKLISQELSKREVNNNNVHRPISYESIKKLLM